MANWVELHQNEKPVLVNFNNISMIYSIDDKEQYSKAKTCLFFNDTESSYCDETYEQLREVIPYFVP